MVISSLGILRSTIPDPNAFIVFGLSVIGNTSFSIEIEFSISLVNRSGRAKVRTER